MAAIAASSIVSDMAKGKALEEAKKITKKVVVEALGGLPPNKMQCSNLGAEALALGADDYEDWFVRHIVDPRALVRKLARAA